MAIFAKLFGARGPKAATSHVENLAGGKAHALTPRYQAATLILSSLLKDRFYAAGSDDAKRIGTIIADLAKRGDALFAAKTAVYARRAHGLRSITHVVAGEVARHCQGNAWGKRFFDRIIRRPDDACEIVGYSLAAYGKTLPNAMKRGIAKAIARFDAYQLAKWRGGRNAVSLVDVVNLCHPKGADGSPIAQLMKGTLAGADTWERALTNAGAQAKASSETAEQAAEKVAELKSAAWGRLVAERKLGYLAVLRNLRNIVEQAPESVDAACAVITDEQAIRKSLVFPFQFAVAADALREIGNVEAKRALAAVSRAVDLALANVPEFLGRTLVAVDDSGSMTSGEAGKRPIDIAAMFAAVLIKRLPNAVLLCFSDDARYRTVDVTAGTLAIAEEIKAKTKSAGTNFHAIFEKAGKRAYDRIVILSDMQGWMGVGTPDGAFNAYRKRSGCDPFVYSFDLNGHGTAQLAGEKVCTLAGWSDKVFDVMKLIEQDREALINEIEKTEI
jgi:60 kDa SS-A/Ro ribonucleoprotein